MFSHPQGPRTRIRRPSEQTGAEIKREDAQGGWVWWHVWGPWRRRFSPERHLSRAECSSRLAQPAWESERSTKPACLLPSAPSTASPHLASFTWAVRAVFCSISCLKKGTKSFIHAFIHLSVHSFTNTHWESSAGLADMEEQPCLWSCCGDRHPGQSLRYSGMRATTQVLGEHRGRQAKFCQALEMVKETSFPAWAGPGHHTWENYFHGERGRVEMNSVTQFTDLCIHWFQPARRIHSVLCLCLSRAISMHGFLTFWPRSKRTS